MGRPPKTNDPTDAVFHALAHAARRRILEFVLSHPGASQIDLIAECGFARQTTASHIRKLQEAGLLAVRRAGRDAYHYANTVPLLETWYQEVAPLITTEAEQLLDIKAVMEARFKGTDMARARPNPGEGRPRRRA